jgi:hypothetical protein
MINTLYDEAKPLLTVRPEVEKELDSDMARIDSICTDIRNDLKDNVDNQEVIEALIRNYRIKIKILEDMLLILKKSEDENSKKESHEI